MTAAPVAKPDTLYCSFCAKSQHEVRKLIAGPTVFICNECVELCMDIINSTRLRDVRRFCLEQALAHAHDPEGAVKAAERYTDFIIGKTPAPEPFAADMSRTASEAAGLVPPTATVGETRA